MTDPYSNAQNPQLNSPAHLEKPKTHGLAIASLVCGIFSFLGITALLAIIFGAVSLSKIRKSGGALVGRGIAIAGIILGGLFFLWIPVLAALSAPAVTKAIQRANEATEMNEMRLFSFARSEYISEHEKPLSDMSDATSSEIYDQARYDALISVQSGEGNWIYFNEVKADDPGDTVVLVSPIFSSGARAFLRNDGSVTRVLPPDVETILSSQTGSRQEIPLILSK